MAPSPLVLRIRVRPRNRIDDEAKRCRGDSVVLDKQAPCRTDRVAFWEVTERDPARCSWRSYLSEAAAGHCGGSAELSGWIFLIPGDLVPFHLPGHLRLDRRLQLADAVAKATAMAGVSRRPDRDLKSRRHARILGV
jgi:hypothetical protein